VTAPGAAIAATVDDVFSRERRRSGLRVARGRGDRGRHTAEVDSVIHYFCCANCRARFLQDSTAVPHSDMTDAAAIRQRFRERGFIADQAFATALQIALALEKPLLIEDRPAWPKPKAAKVLATCSHAADSPAVLRGARPRLAALYEWNYPRQMAPRPPE